MKKVRYKFTRSFSDGSTLPDIISAASLILFPVPGEFISFHFTEENGHADLVLRHSCFILVEKIALL